MQGTKDFFGTQWDPIVLKLPFKILYNCKIKICDVKTAYATGCLSVLMTLVQRAVAVPG